MKTILYLNKKYCTKFSDLKSIIKSAVTNNDKSTMIELLISFRDGILEAWLNDISKIDLTVPVISEQIRLLRTEATDSEIIQKLTTIICSTSFELELNPREYVEVQEMVVVNSDYGKQEHKLGDMISFPDIVKSFNITFFVKIKKSRNDRILLTINDKLHYVSLFEKNKIYSLSCTIDRDNDTLFPSISLQAANCMLGTISVMNFVDLGLDVKWACCNLGAKSIYKEGNYYAWGEVYPKEEFSENTYKGRKSIQNIAGHQSYDAATANLGQNWRIPNKQQWQQLISRCIWTYDKKKGGFWVNRIFLPLTGYKQNNQYYDKKYCYCWTSIKDDDNDSFALSCECCGENISPSPIIVYKNKIAGITIRPVFIK